MIVDSDLSEDAGVKKEDSVDAGKNLNMIKSLKKVFLRLTLE